MGADKSTITDGAGASLDGSAHGRADLIYLGDADRPRSGSSLHPLEGLDEVVFLRGDHAVKRGGESLVLTMDDGRMSREHGRLIRTAAGWLLDDPTSKNGSVVDGTLTRHARLGDGSVIELGRSFFVFRHRPCEVAPSHLATDISSAQLPAWPAGFATFSPDLAQEFASLVHLAASRISIMLQGETGTGKEVVARAIHDLSQREAAFVAINCGALPQSLLEAELFGHRRGAFSGAAVERRGLVRAADGGTLFLDEIGELPVTSQVALLRVLQEREVLPIGDDRPIRVDLRVIAATLRSLDDDTRFRADLYARLAGHVVTLPPLRERREDLGIIIAALLDRCAGGRDIRFAPSALRALLHHDWPHNIRELEQALSRAVALATDGLVGRAHLPKKLGAPRAHVALAPETKRTPDLDDDDRALRARLEQLFAEHEGNVVGVARVLGKDRAQIYKWVRRLGIELARFRRG